MKKVIASILSIISCVTVGPGDKYTVDPYGSVEDASYPSPIVFNKMFDIY